MPDDPLIGRTIDRYQILGALGDGGMARVYRAKHIYLHQEVALKVLHGEVASDRSLARRFHREAQAASRIRHHNVVQILDFGQSRDGLIFMAMELIRGHTLADVLRRERAFPPARAAYIARQILEGLAMAHALGFVHRDLKPKNVMLAGELGRELAKILDFGLVLFSEAMLGEETHLTRQGQVFGTPAYMAPEQVIGQDIGPQADLYAVGVMMYQMLSGSTPFSGPSQQVAWHQVSTPPPPLTDFEGLGPIVMSCLAKKPNQRPADAATLIQMISALGLAHTPPPHMTPPPMLVEASEPPIENSAPPIERDAPPIESHAPLFAPTRPFEVADVMIEPAVELPVSMHRSLPSLDLELRDLDQGLIEDEALGETKRHRAWLAVFLGTAVAVVGAALIFLAPRDQPQQMVLAPQPAAGPPPAAAETATQTAKVETPPPPAPEPPPPAVEPVVPEKPVVAEKPARKAPAKRSPDVDEDHATRALDRAIAGIAVDRTMLESKLARARASLDSIPEASRGARYRVLSARADAFARVLDKVTAAEVNQLESDAAALARNPEESAPDEASEPEATEAAPEETTPAPTDDESEEDATDTSSPAFSLSF